MAGEESTVSTPVYIPWATLISALENLRVNGIPATGKIDKTLWDTQSGAIQGQLLIAFRFLGLIDDNNRVLPALPQLVEAEGKARNPILKAIILEKYKSVVAHDLNTISQGQLDEAFRALKVSGSTLERAERFFVKACQEVGIPISARVAQKTRAASTQPRKARKTAATTLREDQTLDPKSGQSERSWEEKLLDKFPSFDPSWPEELKTKWFAGFEKLMTSKPE